MSETKCSFKMICFLRYFFILDKYVRLDMLRQIHLDYELTVLICGLDRYDDHRYDRYNV